MVIHDKNHYFTVSIYGDKLICKAVHISTTILMKFNQLNKVNIATEHKGEVCVNWQLTW